MSELLDVIVPDGTTSMERAYGGAVSFQRVLEPVNDTEAVPLAFDSPRPDTIRWSVTPGPHRFVVESRLTDVLFPAIDTPAAREYWRQALESPERRYVLDYSYTPPEPGPAGMTLAIHLYWPAGWSPVSEITPANVGVRAGEDYRLRHLFDSGTMPLAPRQLIRPASIALVPVAGLLFWGVYATRELLRRRIGAELTVDEKFLREKIYSEAPEVIAAQWTGITTVPAIETFLRRMERQRKVAVTVEENGDDVKVRVRLVVPRTELSAYDRAGIDALIPTGMEISSDEIRRRHKDQDFDPTDVLGPVLESIASAHRGPAADAWYSKLVSFLLFWGGVALIGFHFEERLVIATAIASVALTILYPAALTRRLRYGYLLPLAGIAAATAATIFINMTGQVPHPYASLGVALVMLAAVKATMSQSSGRESREALMRRQELAAAREWMQKAPMLRDDADPWLEALQLPRRSERKAPDEKWGWALMGMSE